MWGKSGDSLWEPDLLPSSALHILGGELSLSLSYLYPANFLCVLSWPQVHHSVGEDWRSGVQCSLPRPRTGVHSEECLSRSVSSCAKAVSIYTNLRCTVAASNPDVARVLWCVQCPTLLYRGGARSSGYGRQQTLVLGADRQFIVSVKSDAL